MTLNIFYNIFCIVKILHIHLRYNKNKYMISKNNEGGHINLFDRAEKIYVRFKLSENKDTWERWASKTKKNWVKTHQALTLEEVVTFQEEIVNDNFKNFFNIIMKK
jgi:hypothetical protein